MVSIDIYRNKRISCKDYSSIPQMNLEAWREQDVSSLDPFSSEGISFKSAAETYFENTIQDENLDHRFRMPSLEPEDDWITEIPYPIIHQRRT